MKKFIFIITIISIALFSCETDNGVNDSNNDIPTEQPGNSSGNNDNNNGQGNQDDNNNDDQSEKIIFVTDCDEVITVGADGGEVIVVVSTNIDYMVKIPTDAQTWLSIADTRTVRIDNLSFTIAENNSESERSTIVGLLDSDNNVLQNIQFTQKAAEKRANSTPLDDIECAPNEIVYTTKYGYAIDLNTKEGFGGKFKSNNYRDGIGRITFDNDVTQIPKSAFSECQTLTYIKLSNSVVQIGEEAFYNCPELKGIILGNSVKKIGYYAFENCSSLTNITIPDSVSSIGSSAFADCTNLKRVDVSTLSKWCRITFEDNPLCNGADLYINNEKAINITIPSDVGVISGKAFYNCTSIVSVNIPDNVIRVGEQAFYSCDALTDVTIGSGVQTIESGAFTFCLSLQEVYCKPTTPPDGNIDMFATYDGYKYVPLDCAIYVPSASVNAYKRAFCWSEYADKIVGYDF